MQSEKFPQNRDQVGNLLEARKRLKLVPYQITPMQKLLYLGLMTLIPGEVEKSGVLESPEKMVAVEALIKYQVTLNDWLDFTLSGRKDPDFIRHALEPAQEKELNARQKMMIALERILPQDKIDTIIRLIVEIKFVEHWYSKNRQSTIEDVDQYRNLVNAISNILITSVVLDFPASLNTKTSLEDISLDDLTQKYGWIFGDSPQNEIERTIMIMHNMAMAGQVDDDWFGREIDEKLNIHSYAGVVLKQFNQDLVQAHQVLDNIRKKYMIRAQKLGLNPMAVSALDQIQRKLIQHPTYWLTSVGRNSSSVLGRTLRKRAQAGISPFSLEGGMQEGLRERCYVAGWI